MSSNDFKTPIDLRHDIPPIAVSADPRSLAPAVNTAVGFGNEASGDFTHPSPAVIAHAGETEREMFSQGANVVDLVCVIRLGIVGLKQDVLRPLS